MHDKEGLYTLDDQPFVIKALIIFRISVISFFLGIVIVFQVGFGGISSPIPVSLLIISTYILSIIYIFMLGRTRRYRLFLYAQILIDLFIETGIIYSTGGGLLSPFIFFYQFSIIASAIVLSRPASWITASTASILYGVLVNLEFYNVIFPHPLLVYEVQAVSQEAVFFTVLVHIASFYLVAFLSDFLSKRLRQALVAYISKSRDLTNLQAFHENMIANMGSGFVALDLDGRAISTNQAAELILGRTRDKIVGTPVGELFPSVDPAEILPDVAEKGKQVKKHEWPQPL